MAKKTGKTTKGINHIINESVKIGDFCSIKGVENSNINSLKTAVSAYANARKAITDKAKIEKGNGEELDKTFLK